MSAIQKKNRYSGKPRLCLPVAEWPEIDRRLWAEVSIASENLFASDSAAASWSPRRRRIVEQAYGQWLAWLDREKILDLTSAPEDRVSPERVTRFVTQLVERIAPVSVGMMIGALGRMLAVLSPETDWAWMRRLYQDLKGWAKPSRDKRRFVVSSKDLFDLGIGLMRNAEANNRNPIFQALQFRDGLIIALLSARPLRMRNFSMIELGRHLICDAGVYNLRFSSDETKTGQEINVYVPNELVPYLELYLKAHRETLLARREKDTLKTRALWVSREGATMIEPSIRAQIKFRTRDAFGRMIWPHLFRHCAATSMAISDPENVRLAAALLGHNGFSTTERYYVQATGLEAGRQHSKVITDLRQTLKDNAGAA